MTLFVTDIYIVVENNGGHSTSRFFWEMHKYKYCHFEILVQTLEKSFFWSLGQFPSGQSPTGQFPTGQSPKTVPPRQSPQDNLNLSLILTLRGEWTGGGGDVLWENCQRQFSVGKWNCPDTSFLFNLVPNDDVFLSGPNSNHLQMTKEASILNCYTHDHKHGCTHVNHLAEMLTTTFISSKEMYFCRCI